MKVIDEKHGISVCSVNEIPDWVTKKNTVNFFYHQGQIVLVEGSCNFESYKELIPMFLNIPDEMIPEMIRKAAEINLSLGRAFMVIVQIKRIRRKRRWCVNT